ncbi:MAG: hypothetical protein ABIH00_01635 [Armatimonadota bacterium]
MRNKKVLFVLISGIVLVSLILLSFQAFSCEKKSLIAKSVKQLCPAGYEYYKNDAAGISFNKPAGWDVFIDNGVVMIKPSYEGATCIFLYPIWHVNKKMDAVSFLSFMYYTAKKEMPGLEIIDKRANANKTMAEVTTTVTDCGVPAKGFYMVSLAEGRGLYCGYEAPSGEYDSKQTTLREVLKSLSIVPMTFYNASKSGKYYASTPASQSIAPTINTNNFVTKSSSDGTMYVACPPDWQANGGNYFFIAHSPDGKLGVFTSDNHQPKTFDPQQYLLYQLMPFMKCSNTVIAGSEPNNDYMKMLQSQGIPSNAVNFYGETTNGEGLRLKFAIMVSATNLQGYGAPGGYVSVIGAFGAPELFDRNFNVLLAMALSVTADSGKIMGNLRANLDRLGQASKTMSQTGDVVIQGLRQGSANTDRAFDKYNYYSAGEEARYSPGENKIYVVDSSLEKYAENPNYSGEMLTEVPDHLWNQLPHDRQYAP